MFHLTNSINPLVLNRHSDKKCTTTVSPQQGPKFTRWTSLIVVCVFTLQSACRLTIVGLQLHRDLVQAAFQQALVKSGCSSNGARGCEFNDEGCASFPLPSPIRYIDYLFIKDTFYNRKTLFIFFTLLISFNGDVSSKESLTYPGKCFQRGNKRSFFFFIMLHKLIKLCWASSAFAH